MRTNTKDFPCRAPMYQSGDKRRDGKIPLCNEESSVLQNLQLFDPCVATGPQSSAGGLLVLRFSRVASTWHKTIGSSRARLAWGRTALDPTIQQAGAA
jgi:hypothetical protein